MPPGFIIASMKQRTLKRHRPGFQPVKEHHNVNVVLLDRAVSKIRKARLLNSAADPGKSCLYVGMTGRTPEERFANHQRGDKVSSFVKRYGIRLLPEFYAHRNPMPCEASAQMEKDLTEDLRRSGYTVLGGTLNGHSE